MDRESILQQLEEERDRLSAAIEALRGTSHRSNSRPMSITAGSESSSKRGAKRKGITAAGRKRLSELMKKRWRERRKKSAVTK